MEDHFEASPTVSGFAKIDPERRIVYGWFSVVKQDGQPVVDLQGDVISEGTLIDSVHKFMLDSRAGKVMHAGEPVADIVESVFFSEDLQKALGIDLNMVGWFGGMKFWGTDAGNAAWELVKTGAYKAFSIGGVGTRESVS